MKTTPRVDNKVEILDNHSNKDPKAPTRKRQFGCVQGLKLVVAKMPSQSMFCCWKDRVTIEANSC